jgi:hypothetical protein
MLNSTMMGLSRQFLNVILGSKRDPAAVKSLSRVHVENFFRSPTTSTPQILPGAQAAADLMGNLKDDEATAADIMTEESIQLRPCTEFTFGVAVGDQPRKIDCFPILDGMVICADQAGRVFSANSKASIVGTMPSLHQPKRTPTSIFVWKPDIDKDFRHPGGYPFRHGEDSQAGGGLLHH